MPTPGSIESVEPPGPAAQTAGTDAIFARIARRYDAVNRVLALGQDQAWRRRVADQLLTRDRVLDLGAGTGAADRLFSGSTVVALDPAQAMLDLNPASMRVVGKGEQIPFGDNTFEAVFTAFVMRNLDSVDITLAEIARVLRPGGKAGIVGLTRPVGGLAAAVHRVATGVTVPLAGLLIGARQEYVYLHRSLDKLPPPEELYRNAPLHLEQLWRMGPLGFVYGAILRN